MLSALGKRARDMSGSDILSPARDTTGGLYVCTYAPVDSSDNPPWVFDSVSHHWERLEWGDLLLVTGSLRYTTKLNIVHDSVEVFVPRLSHRCNIDRRDFEFYLTRSKLANLSDVT